MVDHFVGLALKGLRTRNKPFVSFEIIVTVVCRYLRATNIDADLKSSVNCKLLLNSVMIEIGNKNRNSY